MLKELMETNLHILKRNSLVGALLRSVGLKHYAIEHTNDGVNVFGSLTRRIPYSDFTAPVALSRSFGFPTIVLSLKGGDIVKIAGLKKLKVTQFIRVANNGFCQSIAGQFEKAWPEIENIYNALIALDNPQQYPSACLIHPLVLRTEKILIILPSVIPEGVLPIERKGILDTILAFQKDPQRKRNHAINIFIERELSEMGQFFDRIESKPLTPEQRLAVITDEDATLVLAGAGSGKTSVIVAKAAYLINRKIRQPEEIMLMAFGKDAAVEMAGRIKERSGASVDALTFHALGNKIIREVEGRGPALAEHASDEAKYRALIRDILIKDVAKHPNLGRVLLEWFSEFYWPYKSEWDFKTQDEYYQWVESHELRTLNGDRVKSYEEWEISNWLYRNGIKFEYEPNYEGPLPADARGAYKPDFRLTESGIYIEHFGVRKSRNPDGSTYLTTAPHIDRERYLSDMSWKRKVHQDNGTTLIETFSYEQVEGCLLTSLQEKIAPFVKFKPLPQNQVLDLLSEMGLVDAFTQTLVIFLRHFKSSRSSIEHCRSRAEDGGDIPRSHAFLMIFEQLLIAYQRRMGDEIDFEDMINRATQYVETGRYKSPYLHLLVDEFQDISEGRARLLCALKAQHSNARIFAVGDDWQSIFRFAGSDISLMRDFGEEFGGGFGGETGVHSTVDLGRTFRSVDKIALPARHFVLQNPSQIQKKVATATTTNAPSIMVSYYKRGQDDAMLKFALLQISKAAESNASVLLLGRYNFLRPKNLTKLSSEFPKLSLRFMTAHGSKGLEADHVIILNAVSDRMGFPSEVVDDPLLNLVLPKPEAFDHAEERRLFYVALTRAKKSVTILADREKPSVFVRELVSHPEYETVQINNSTTEDHRCNSCGGRMLTRDGKNGDSYYCEHRLLCGETLPSCNVCREYLPRKSKKNSQLFTCNCGAEFPTCPECHDGWLVDRHGKYGNFKGCVKYPACTGKAKK